MFWGFGTEQQSCWPSTTRNCRERMKTSHGQENSITIYVTYVCMNAQRTAAARRRPARVADGIAPHEGTISAKAWLVWRGHANTRPRRRPAKSCSGGLAGCRCNIDDTAACDYCSILTRVSSGQRKSSRALGSGATHAHRTARPTHALHNAPRWRP